MNSLNVPQLRFPGFDGEWEKSKLLTKIKTIDSGWSPQCEEFPSNEDEWGVLKTTSVVWEGFNASANKKLPEKLNPRPELEVSINDVLITRAGPTSRVGVIVHVNKVRAKLMLSDKLIRIRSNDITSSLFLAISLSNNSVQKQLVSKSSGLAESQTNISQKILLNTEITLPTLPEQQKIASFLSAVDEKIQQLARRKELVEQYKKGVMQQLFSGKLRFKDENGKDYPDWEEKKLGDVGKFISGTGFTEKEQGGSDGFPFFKVSDMNLVNNKIKMNEANNYVTEKQVKRAKYKVITSNSIIFAKVGAAIFLERKRIANNFLIDNNMMAFIPLGNISYHYHLFNNIRLSRYAQVGALPSYNSSDLAIIKILIHCKEEQQKIANFLSGIDGKIEQVNGELEKTQEFKKGLLQQLFV